MTKKTVTAVAGLAPESFFFSTQVQLYEIRCETLMDGDMLMPSVTRDGASLSFEIRDVYKLEDAILFCCVRLSSDHRASHD